MHVLGNTLEEIGKEKAGIMKAHVPCFSYKQQTEGIEKVFQSVSENKKSFLFFAEEKPLFPFSLGVNGTHQYSNAALSVYLSHYWHYHFLSKHSNSFINQKKIDPSILLLNCNPFSSSSPSSSSSSLFSLNFSKDILVNRSLLKDNHSEWNRKKKKKKKKSFFFFLHFFLSKKI